MEAPGFFILLVIFLALVFGACMVTGAVWLFFGWRKKARSVQLLSALPFGVGLLIIGPLLLLAIATVVWWLLADWRGISAPAAQHQGKPKITSLDAAMSSLFHIGPRRRSASEFFRWGCTHA